VAVDTAWDPPSGPVAALIRRCASAVLADPGSLLDDIDAAVLAVTPHKLAGDPALTAAVVATNHANVIHWGTANVRDPGRRVPANLSPEVLDVARDIVRRGLDDTTLHTYRIGQNVAWRAWMARAFTLSTDPEELRELLDVTSRSIFTFVDDTIDGIQAHIDRERKQLIRGTHAERLETVNLILEGAPITSERAGARLRYQLSRRHTAAVLWSDRATNQGELERLADALARATDARRPLSVVSSARSLWAWFAGAGDPDLGIVASLLDASPGVRVALGASGFGLDGFRRSHLEALATQRLMHRMPGELRIATYEDVQLVALTAGDEERASEFVTRTLGGLETAGPDLRETLRVYIREGFSASRAARVLYTHRNTVLNRLARAQELLPAPLERRGLQVGLALEIVHWLGARGAGTPP
jgi:DNA-binding PucR family transcriptional regulator